MINVQIVERPEENLYKELLRAMRSGELRTFTVKNRGKKVTHMTYGGYMNWAHDGNVITCQVKNVRKPEAEWQFLHALLGRLADRYAPYIHSINIQFPDAEWDD